MVIGGYRVTELLKRTVSESREDRVPMLAASAAYAFFFSLFPLLLFLAPVLSFVGEKERLVIAIMERVAPLVPGSAREVIESVLRDVVFVEGAPALMSAGALLAAFAASNVIATLMTSLNTAYDVSEARPFWKRRLMALLFVILGGLAIALAAPVIIAGKQVVSVLGANLGVADQMSNIIAWVQYPVTFLVLVAILWLVYYILPATRQNPRLALVGASIAATLWVVVTLGFRLYVSNFGAYNRTYGAIGGIIVLLMWMWLTMLVLLAVGELNSELHRGTGLIERGGTAAPAGGDGTAEQLAEPGTEIA